MSRRVILKEIFRGKGIGRSLFNLSVANYVSIEGRVLDVGGKGSPSYLRFLPPQTAGRIIVLDIKGDSTTTIQGSVVRLPFCSRSFDCVFCFNVLEHVFNFETSLREIRRVLTDDGVLYGYVPFLVGIHGDPHDHWRYTQETLERILVGAGFQTSRIEVQGGALLVVFDLLRPFFKFRLLRLLSAAIVLPIDRLAFRVLGQSYVRKYPLGYFFVARPMPLPPEGE